MQPSPTNLIELFQSIHNGNALLSLHKLSQQINQFLIEWYLFSENQIKRIEQIYVWSLIHGWSLTDYADKKDIQPSEPQYQESSQQDRGSSSVQEQLLNMKQSFVYFLGRNEAIIRHNDTIFWVNPTNSKPQALSCFETVPCRLVVLTSSHYLQLFKVLALINMKVSFKIITLEPIYKKLKLLLGYLKTHQSPEYFSTTLGTIYFLKAQQYFEYGGFLWFASSCCWYEPSYDLLLTPTESKDNSFLIESPKLNDVKFIYYGWKKNIITEYNYQKYSANQPEEHITAKTTIFHQIEGNNGTYFKKNQYLDFIQKELVKELDEIDQEQVWNSCEQIQLTAGQTIVRKTTIFDHVFLLLDGEFEYTSNGNIRFPADKFVLYGLQELRHAKNQNEFSLKCISKGTVLRIAKHNLKFLLYDHFG